MSSLHPREAATRPAGASHPPVLITTLMQRAESDRWLLSPLPISMIQLPHEGKQQQLTTRARFITPKRLFYTNR
jgi:hypothetical protein